MPKAPHGSSGASAGSEAGRRARGPPARAGRSGQGVDPVLVGLLLVVAVLVSSQVVEATFGDSRATPSPDGIGSRLQRRLTGLWRWATPDCAVDVLARVLRLSPIVGLTLLAWSAQVGIAPPATPTTSPDQLTPEEIDDLLAILAADRDDPMPSQTPVPVAIEPGNVGDRRAEPTVGASPVLESAAVAVDSTELGLVAFVPLPDEDASEEAEDAEPEPVERPEPAPAPIPPAPVRPVAPVVAVAPPLPARSAPAPTRTPAPTARPARTPTPAASTARPTATRASGPVATPTPVRVRPTATPARPGVRSALLTQPTARPTATPSPRGR